MTDLRAAAREVADSSRIANEDRPPTPRTRMQVRNLPPHTLSTYLKEITRFARYFGKSPEPLGEKEIRTYQLYLTNQKKLAPSSIVITIAALRFLYVRARTLRRCPPAVHNSLQALFRRSTRRAAG
jgi:site-specific recombinase XerD